MKLQQMRQSIRDAESPQAKRLLLRRYLFVIMQRKEYAGQFPIRTFFPDSNLYGFSVREILVMAREVMRDIRDIEIDRSHDMQQREEKLSEARREYYEEGWQHYVDVIPPPPDPTPHLLTRSW